MAGSGLDSCARRIWPYQSSSKTQWSSVVATMGALASWIPMLRSSGMGLGVEQAINRTQGNSSATRLAVSSPEPSTTITSPRAWSRCFASEFRHCAMYRYPFTDAMTTDSEGFGSRMAATLTLLEVRDPIICPRHDVTDHESCDEAVGEPDQAPQEG